MGETLEILNDGMNYLYCRPSEYYLETLVFRDTFAITKTLGLIAENDLVNTMDLIAEFAGENYYNEAREDKEPLIFSFSAVSGASTNNLYIEAQFVMHAGLPSASEDEYPYQDSWKYGQWNQDVSDECSLEEANYDAADLFRRDLRRSLVFRNNNSHYYLAYPHGVCFAPYGGGCTFINELVPIFPITETCMDDCMHNPNDDIGSDNLYDRLMFMNRSHLDNYDECLSSSEMNFYFESMSDLAMGIMPYPINTTVVMQIEVGYWNDVFFHITTIWQAMEVVVATKIQVTDSNYYVPIPLPCC